MSWSLTIKADRPLNDEHVVKCMSTVLGRDVSAFPERQAWGWPGPCDVHNPEGSELRVSGAYYSFDRAVSYAEQIGERLLAHGYKITITKPAG